MPQTHLELQPAYGDETVGGLRFILHGAGSEQCDRILREGFRFTPGEATVSAKLMAALDKATPQDGPAGKICVLTVPPDFHVGYPVLSTAFIDRAGQMVIGAPLKYAAARQQLALYPEADTDAARAKIESEILNGSPLPDHAGFTIDRRNVLGTFAAGASLRSVLSGLEVSLRSLEDINYISAEDSLAELFECREPAQAVLVPTMAHALVVQMAESVVMSQLRMMRWQGLAALGFKFKEGSADAKIEQPTPAAQRQAVSELRKLAATTELFSGELAWLKNYVMRELELMRIELDGAELEAA